MNDEAAVSKGAAAFFIFGGWKSINSKISIDKIHSAWYIYISRYG
jgi:hypothetical protein